MPRYKRSVSEGIPKATPEGICPKCKGAGYLRADVPIGHPQFGKPIPCICKEKELAEKRREQLYNLSQLHALRDKRLANFNKFVPGVQEAYKAAKDFARDPDGWLLLAAKSGTGKTHLAAAIANECLDRGMTVLFTTAPDLLDHLRATFAPLSTIAYDELFTSMREAELLVIDDLGAQYSTPWAVEKLFQLLNYRYINRLLTVITSNNDGLQTIDERIASRLGDTGLVRQIKMEQAEDYRPFTGGPKQTDASFK